MFLRQVALHVINQIDQLSASFFSFDEEERDYRFRFQGVKCTLSKFRRSASGVRPSWLHWQLTTSDETNELTESVDFWLAHPNQGDPEVNRAAFKRAVEKYRNDPSAVMAQIDLQE